MLSVTGVIRKTDSQGYHSRHAKVLHVMKTFIGTSSRNRNARSVITLRGGNPPYLSIMPLNIPVINLRQNILRQTVPGVTLRDAISL